MCSAWVPGAPGGKAESLLALCPRKGDTLVPQGGLGTWHPAPRHPSARTGLCVLRVGAPCGGRLGVSGKGQGVKGQTGQLEDPGIGQGLPPPPQA